MNAFEKKITCKAIGKKAFEESLKTEDISEKISILKNGKNEILTIFNEYKISLENNFDITNEEFDYLSADLGMVVYTCCNRLNDALIRIESKAPKSEKEKTLEFAEHIVDSIITNAFDEGKIDYELDAVFTSIEPIFKSLRSSLNNNILIYKEGNPVIKKFMPDKFQSVFTFKELNNWNKDIKDAFLMRFHFKLEEQVNERFPFVFKKFNDKFLTVQPELWGLHFDDLKAFIEFLPTTQWQKLFVMWCIDNGLDTLKDSREKTLLFSELQNLINEFQLSIKIEKPVQDTPAEVSKDSKKIPKELEKVEGLLMATKPLDHNNKKRVKEAFKELAQKYPHNTGCIYEGKMSVWAYLVREHNLKGKLRSIGITQKEVSDIATNKKDDKYISRCK